MPAKMSPATQDPEAPPQAADAQDEPEPFNPLYYYVYIFSMLIFVLGLLLWILPEKLTGGDKGWGEWLTGSLMLPTGAFLMTNSDLVVTYIRLSREIGRFKENNKQFQKNLEKQAAEVRRLNIAADAFEQIDEKFGGSIAAAAGCLEQLQTAAEATIAMNSQVMCRLYCDFDKDQMIDQGEETEKAITLMGSVFSGVFKNYDARMDKLKEGLLKSPKYVEQKGLSIDEFGKVFQKALEADKKDIDKIPDMVVKKLAKVKEEEDDW